MSQEALNELKKEREQAAEVMAAHRAADHLRIALASFKAGKRDEALAEMTKAAEWVAGWVPPSTIKEFARALERDEAARPLMLQHSDGVSGTTILPDGTKLHWTEGYSSATVLYPDGRREEVPPHTEHPILTKQRELEENGRCASRPMTKTEEDEWEKESW